MAMIQEVEIIPDSLVGVEKVKDGKYRLIYLQWVQGLERVADLMDTVCHQKG